MINIKNSQRKVKIDLKQLQNIAEKILMLVKYPDFDLGILITNNKKIHEYNLKFRQKDKPTDILSFPYHSDLKPGNKIKILDEEDKNLGDIIISAEYMHQAARKLNRSFEQHLKIMLVHGVCHLLGYDHITDTDYRRMRAKESFLLRKLQECL